MAGARTPGKREDTRQARCAGRRSFAHSGAGEEIPDGGDATADATERRPGQGGSHRVGCTPWSWLVRARRSGGEDTRQARCPGCGRRVHTRAGGWALDRAARPGRGRLAHTGAGEEVPGSRDARPMPLCASRGGVVVMVQAVCPGRVPSGQVPVASRAPLRGGARGLAPSAAALWGIPLVRQGSGSPRPRL